MTEFNLYGSEVKDGYGGYVLEDVYISMNACELQEYRCSAACRQVTLNLPNSIREFAEWVLEMTYQYDMTPIELAAIMNSIQLEKGHPND